MNASIIEQVIEQLRAMPQPLQQEVLSFARTLTNSKVQGVSGQQLLRFAGSISADDLQLMRQTIEQDCEGVDLNEW
jgi:hypothetical protein